MMLVASTTELTTAATDALLALICAAAWGLLGVRRTADPWRAGLWRAVFALVGLASLLGAIAHGLELAAPVRDALWHPLYLALGLAVALFVVGAVRDWRGEAAARRLLRPALVTGALFYAATQALGGAFLLFVAYEGVAMLTAWLLYAGLALGGRRRGAATVAVAIALNIAAAAVQASGTTLGLPWGLDHNGLFHLVMVPALVLLVVGLHRGQLPQA